MAGKMRKAINFDLDTKKLKEVYCTTNNPLEYLKAYKEIKTFMKENGFSHRQLSGYSSDKPMSKTQVERFVEKLTDEFPWFAQCVSRFDVTNIGKQYDMMKKIQNSEPVKQKIKAGEKNAPRKKAPFQSWRVKNEEKLFEHSHSDDKLMSSGMRNVSREPLTKEEINFVKSEIRRIGADESVFIFNDEAHMDRSTCYNCVQDKIYVTRNVFPDNDHGSTHPRDVMSVAAVLAHEYYGHRVFRNEYLADLGKKNADRTTPQWADECRASITAAKNAPNLSQQERADLINDAKERARESGNILETDKETDSFMKGVLYGYSDEETEFNRTHYACKSSCSGDEEKRICNDNVSEVQYDPESDFGR